ncbi:hypothetical protein OROGR_013484 [Orobanche gracilis]
MAAVATGWGNKWRRRVVEEISTAELIPGFRQLQSRALGMIRSHVLSVLKSTSSQI